MKPRKPTRRCTTEQICTVGNRSPPAKDNSKEACRGALGSSSQAMEREDTDVPPPIPDGPGSAHASKRWNGYHEAAPGFSKRHLCS